VGYSLNVATWRTLADGFFDSLLGGEDVVTLQEFRIQRLPEDDSARDPEEG